MKGFGFAWFCAFRLAEANCIRNRWHTADCWLCAYEADHMTGRWR